MRIYKFNAAISIFNSHVIHYSRHRFSCTVQRTVRHPHKLTPITRSLFHIFNVFVLVGVVATVINILPTHIAVFSVFIYNHKITYLTYNARIDIRNDAPTRS